MIVDVVAMIPVVTEMLAEELQRRRGTRIGEHLKLVLSIVDRQVQ